jgi:hypothetical protein
MTKEKRAVPPDRLLAMGFGLMALPWLATILAQIFQADGAFYAFIIGPFILIETLVLLPILALIEIGWFSYFIYAGGSLFDLKLRKERGHEYRRLVPHFFGIGILVASILISQNRAFKDWAFRQGRLTTDAELMENFRKNRADFEHLLAISDAPITSETAHLIEKLQLQGGIKGKTFTAYHVGWALGSDSKGYVYKSVPPGPLIESLDGPLPNGEHVAFRKIDGDWYLYIASY